MNMIKKKMTLSSVLFVIIVLTNVLFAYASTVPLTLTPINTFSNNGPLIHWKITFDSTVNTYDIDSFDFSYEEGGVPYEGNIAIRATRKSGNSVYLVLSINDVPEPENPDGTTSVVKVMGTVNGESFTANAPGFMWRRRP
jgi:hypothetical protein